MSFVARNVIDRDVQFPHRYQLVEVSPGIYDLVPVPGEITAAGTYINKAYLDPIETGLQAAAAKADAALPKTGGTLTDNLTIQKAAYPGVVLQNATGLRAQMLKHVDAGADYGSGFYDFAGDGTNAFLVVQRNAATLAQRLRLTDNNVSYKIYGEHNKGDLLVYKGDLQTLGYTSLASVTETGVYKIYQGNAFLSDYPSFLTAKGLIYGMLEVSNVTGGDYLIKRITASDSTSAKHCLAYAFGNDWRRLYDTDNTLIEWTKLGSRQLVIPTSGLQSYGAIADISAYDAILTVVDFALSAAYMSNVITVVTGGVSCTFGNTAVSEANRRYSNLMFRNYRYIMANVPTDELTWKGAGNLSIIESQMTTATTNNGTGVAVTSQNIIQTVYGAKFKITV